MAITEKLTQVFREVFDDDTLVLTDEMTADDVDAWDSLSHVNLMIAIEIAFGIEFKQNEIQSFANVGELRQGIEEKLGK
ncbi:MAG: acyl carrier protein [Brevefilum sp.]|nr:acyl carrier protein [Brevefilum sp.]MDW7753947.1 acyl carrier protein [Brevefilum sp.]